MSQFSTGPTAARAISGLAAERRGRRGHRGHHRPAQPINASSRGGQDARWRWGRARGRFAHGSGAIFTAPATSSHSPVRAIGLPGLRTERSTPVRKRRAMAPTSPRRPRPRRCRAPPPMSGEQAVGGGEQSGAVAHHEVARQAVPHPFSGTGPLLQQPQVAGGCSASVRNKLVTCARSATERTAEPAGGGTLHRKEHASAGIYRPSRTPSRGGSRPGRGSCRGRGRWPVWCQASHSSNVSRTKSSASSWSAPPRRQDICGVPGNSDDLGAHGGLADARGEHPGRADGGLRRVEPADSSREVVAGGVEQDVRDHPGSPAGRTAGCAARRRRGAPTAGFDGCRRRRSRRPSPRQC